MPKKYVVRCWFHEEFNVVVEADSIKSARGIARDEAQKLAPTLRPRSVFVFADAKMVKNLEEIEALQRTLKSLQSPK